MNRLKKEVNIVFIEGEMKQKCIRCKKNLLIENFIREDKNIILKTCTNCLEKQKKQKNRCDICGIQACF